MAVFFMVYVISYTEGIHGTSKNCFSISRGMFENSEISNECVMGIFESFCLIVYFLSLFFLFGYGLNCYYFITCYRTNCDERVFESIRKNNEVARQPGISLSASGLNDPLGSVQQESVEMSLRKKCCRPSGVMNITANGNVLPCYMARFSAAVYASLVLGNVFEYPVVDIWLALNIKTSENSSGQSHLHNAARGAGSSGFSG